MLKMNPVTGNLDLVGSDNATVTYFGNPNTNGSWRIINDGTNLSFQRREAGVWVEKSAATP